MKVASWNINSVKVRKDRLLRWLGVHTPDLVCLQELKAPAEAFPGEELAALGYQAVVVGQRTYNGVAILARETPQEVETSLDGDDDDLDARYLSAQVAGLRVICCYVPNGGEVSSPKYAYKLRWLDRLEAHLAARYTPRDPLLLCGDFNIAPEDRDCYDPEGFHHSVLGHHEVRQRWRRLRDWGLVDTFRIHQQEAGKYSWWDYRMLAFPKGRGARIDFVLATPPLAERCLSASIDRDERKGKLPSDHAPVLAELRWP